MTDGEWTSVPFYLANISEFSKLYFTEISKFFQIFSTTRKFSGHFAAATPRYQIPLTFLKSGYQVLSSAKDKNPAIF